MEKLCKVIIAGRAPKSDDTSYNSHLRAALRACKRGDAVGVVWNLVGAGEQLERRRKGSKRR